MTTTVAVREEVEKALGSDLTPKKRQEILQRVEQVVEKYSSPYPDANYLAQIEGLCPGFTREILQNSIDDVRHRRVVEERSLSLKEKELSLIESIASGEFKSTNSGRILGFVSYLALLIFSGSVYYLGAEKLAYIAFGTGVFSIIVQIIRGGSGSAVTVTARKIEGPE